MKFQRSARRPHAVGSAAFSSKTTSDRSAVLRLTRQIVQARSVGAVLAVIHQSFNSPFFDERHCAAALVRIAKLRLACSQKSTYGAATAEAKHGKEMHVKDAFAVSSIAAYGQRFLASNQFQPRQFANILWAVAATESTASPAIEAFAAALVGITGRCLPEMIPQELANTTWALARLYHRAGDSRLEGAAFCELQVRTCSGQLTRCFRAQELANIVWALATLLASNEEPLLESLTQCVVHKITELTPQGMSSIAWALTRLQARESSRTWFAAATGGSSLQSDTCDVQTLVNLSWAWAPLQTWDSTLLATLAVSATKRLYECTPQGLVMLAGAFALPGLE